MVTKTITITESAYEILKKLKRKEESFSEVIARALEKKRVKLNDFAGRISDSVGETLLKSIKENRDKSAKRMEKFA
jgi:predicted CopG family antitoxin